MKMPRLTDALCIGGAIGLAAVLVNSLLNWRFVPRLRPVAPNPVAGPAPSVSILVPARNEETRIAPCLRSLLAQEYPNFEILVLDDRSEDGTAAVARRFGFATEPEGRHRLLSGRPLPPRWTGKAWACQQLAEAARGEYLLFTDADTEHHPASVRTALAWARHVNADLLTLWPYQLTGSWSELLVIPLIFVVAGGALPHWWLAVLQANPALARLVGPRRLRSLGAANGQFLLFRRERYQDLGGHRVVANHLVEDVALGRAVAERTVSGFILASASGIDLVRCRMYTSFSEMWEGFTKNLHPLFEGNQAAFAASVLVQAWLFVWPFVAALWRRSPAVGAQLALVFAVRAFAAARYRTSFWSVLLHPFGYSLALLIAGNSYRRASGQGVVWKGRLYRAAADGAGPGLTSGHNKTFDVL